MMPTISLCMIAKNEAHNLHRSLAAVAAAFDDIVVVDTGSEDDTRKIAKSLGARVIDHAWTNDFSEARNVSIENASGDWIMWLDGDNYVSPEAVKEMRSNLTSGKGVIYWCTEVVVPEGERLIQKRIFPRRDDIRFTGRVHEQLSHPPDFKLVLTPIEILHWGYHDKAEAREKGLRNLRLLEIMAKENPTDLYVQYQMGRTLLNLRRFDPAAFWLSKAVGNRAGESLNRSLFLHAHILLARAVERLDRSETVERVLAVLIGRAPDYGPGFYEYGRWRYKNMDFSGAIEPLKTFLELGAVEPVAGLNDGKMKFSAAMMLGRALEKIGSPLSAMEIYELAGRLAPEHPEPGLAAARLCLDQGQKDNAREHLENCLKFFPENRRAAALLAQAEGGSDAR